MNAGLPDGPDGLTPAWLSGALKHDVRSVKVTRFGEDEAFTGGGLFRLQLDSNSWVAKLSPSPPVMRATFASANQREVMFYIGMGRGLPVPDCAYGAFDPATGASVLLLQDLAELRPGKFLGGLSAAETRSVVAALADIHGTWWNAPGVAELSGADFLDEFEFAKCWPAYPRALSRLLPDVVLPDSFRALGDYVAANAKAVFGALMEDGPCTVLHRDCQADNVMFNEDGTALILDWQILGKGRGVYDVAYLLISSLQPDLRRQIERDILHTYRQRLLLAGINGYSWDHCWREYTQSVIGKLMLTVVATVLFENDTDYKRAWRKTDLERLLAFCAEHEIGPDSFA